VTERKLVQKNSSTVLLLRMDGGKIDEDCYTNHNVERKKINTYLY
jgi:hypothetical protein